MERVRDVLPPEAYLVGGTALAVHLRHRKSRDLDFFLSAPVDLDALEARLRKVGKLVVTWRDTQILNGVLDGAKVRFLEAADQRIIEPITDMGGVRVAGVGDLMATKLNVVVRRPEARDYFDLLIVEQEAHRYVEEGLALFVERYRPTSPDQAISAIVRSLGYFGDVADAPGLPMRVTELERYWQRRVPELTAHLDRHGLN
ncbi:MAG: nucleotidyl transferase AbiEii/AbiGii toxin family protein [Egibacteraceae bacterium]